ncbi:hypothetical protein M4951_16450 [Blastopirellula sp. J2-11]|uniref:hypothetical protein n=1 Tax=Blastopirellula sp. J2-11 TaxID=2943192 RepID=UPI0021C69B9F|nr:hypothetical protein [Blastopirellula sp. J2-11]UUO04971.1 hypothetical protein M4951_16450 [Blastopirellula sp. J2-11]
MPHSEEELYQAKVAHDPWLSSQLGVVGTGIGLNHDGQLCILILTAGISEATKSLIVERLSGYPVGFEETGDFTAQ